MADKRIHPDDLNAEKPIGLRLPFARDSINIFSLNYTTLEQSKTNIRNLLLTSKGERVYLPDYGCDIRKMLFENNSGDLQSKAEEIIRSAFAKWLPYIEIKTLDLEVDQDNEHLFWIRLVFNLNYDPETFEEITIPIMVT